jgi:predicted Zn finger-like uncharacterized protein
MSLVTRCTACGTVFRVVQDQLKVSSGWVRCGKCGEVFNALQTLFDLDRDGPVASPPGTGSMGGATASSGAVREPSSGDFGRATSAERSAPPSGFGPLASPSGHASVHAGSATQVPGERPTPPSSFAVSAPSPVDFPISVLPEDQQVESGRDDGSVWPANGGHSRWIEPELESGFDNPRGNASDSRQLVVAGAPEAIGSDAPEFLREDRRRAFWSSPLARGLLSFAALMLGLLMLAQVAIHERDRVAALWPSSRPLLAQWCRLAGCELLEAPRRLEAFTVESTSLTKAGSPTDAYRLSITLRNRAARSATLPSVELALTDTDGQLIARRALHPADFRIQRPVVPPGSETTLQLVMTTPKGRVNGYTIDLFYP